MRYLSILVGAAVLAGVASAVFCGTAGLWNAANDYFAARVTPSYKELERKDPRLRKPPPARKPKNGPASLQRQPE